jgi:hypothetical protein
MKRRHKMTYETPELFEIGDVEEMTHGKRFGNEEDPDYHPTWVKFFASFTQELVGEERE